MRAKTVFGMLLIKKQTQNIHLEQVVNVITELVALLLLVLGLLPANTSILGALLHT